MKVMVCQYLASSKDNHWLDDIIAGWTKLFNKKTPPYSHSEICFRWSPFLDTALLIHLNIKIEPFRDMCFSSATAYRKSKKEKFRGTRWRPFKDVTHNKDRWDFYEKEFTEIEVENMIRRAIEITGRKYYMAGLFLDFFMPFGIISQLIGKKLKEFYCSQAVYFVLKNRRTRVSPRRLYTWILKDGFKKMEPPCS